MASVFSPWLERSAPPALLVAPGLRLQSQLRVACHSRRAPAAPACPCCRPGRPFCVALGPVRSFPTFPPSPASAHYSGGFFCPLPIAHGRLPPLSLCSQVVEQITSRRFASLPVLAPVLCTQNRGCRLLPAQSFPTAAAASLPGASAAESGSGREPAYSDEPHVFFLF